MNERIKLLRKALHMTQQEFAEKLNIKRGAIANYEVGRNQPIDAVISLICRTYNVDEKWLRAGEGNMFLSPNDVVFYEGDIINERIRQVRKALKLTQADFGSRISIRESTICRYESSSRNPLDAVIHSICREFCVDEKNGYAQGKVKCFLIIRKKI